MNNTPKITIAIDGYSSTGKSTLAKQLAKHLNYIYVDTGAMYRAVTLFAIQNNFIGANYFKIDDFVLSLHDIEISFTFNPNLGFAEVYLNGLCVEQDIRTMLVSNHVSKIAAVPEVRYLMVKQQQSLKTSKNGIVMDGRDIGTVVFPNAELKLFMTASDQVRAQRRFDELKSRGELVSFDDVLRNVRERDYIDSNRENSPLKQADDAVLIDNSDLTLSEQFKMIVKLIETKLS